MNASTFSEISSWLSIMFPSITGTTVLVTVGAAVGWFVKAKIEENIKRSINLELEQTKMDLNLVIEQARYEFRVDEEKRKADQKRSDEEVSNLKNGGLSAVAARQSALSIRRMNSIERIWDAVVDLQNLKSLMEYTCILRMDKLLESTKGPEREKIQKFADKLWDISKVDDYKYANQIEKERLYISPITWALFLAYRQILSYPVSQLAVLRAGLDSSILQSIDKTIELAKSAMPEYASFIDKYKESSLLTVITALEQKLFNNLFMELDQSGLTQGGVGPASDILKHVAEVASEMAKAQIDSMPPT